MCSGMRPERRGRRPAIGGEPGQDLVELAEQLGPLAAIGVVAVGMVMAMVMGMVVGAER